MSIPAKFGPLFRDKSAGALRALTKRLFCDFNTIVSGVLSAVLEKLLGVGFIPESKEVDPVQFSELMLHLYILVYLWVDITAAFNLHDPGIYITR